MPPAATTAVPTPIRRGRWCAALALTTLVAAEPVGAAEVAKVWYSRLADPGATDGSVWTVNGDGTGDRQVTVGAWPRLSPDGRLMLFHRDNATVSRGNVYLRDLIVGTETKVLPNGDFLVHYDWNADASRIIFDSFCTIYRAHADGTMAEPLVEGDCYADAPIVNPVDGRIAFHHQSGLVVANADGTNPTPVTNTGAGDYWPAWSADGAWLSFGRFAGDQASDYYRVRPDGNGLTHLTPHHAESGEGWGPRGIWTADGGALIVPGIVFGVQGLYALSTDGSGTVRRLSISAGNAPDFVGTVTGSEVTGPVVLPVATTTTTTTSTTSTTASTTTTTSSTLTTTTSSTTATSDPTTTTSPTTSPPGEECGNCRDDDQDGLTDFEDPACCAEDAASTLVVKRVRIVPKAGAHVFKLASTLARGDVDLSHEDLFVQLRQPGSGEVLCAQLPSRSFTRKGKGFRFTDRGHAVTSAAGIDGATVKRKRDPSGKLAVRGAEVRLASPAAGTMQITIAAREPGAAASRCARGQASFKAGKGGALRFP